MDDLSKNLFFKPTKLYKEFLILDLIEKNSNITQRQISCSIGAATSMINNYLNEYEIKGYIKRKYISSKNVEYFVTKKGNERRMVLNIWYYKSSQSVYQSARDNIAIFLEKLMNKGYKNILLYGAGEVAKIILQVLNDDNNIFLEVLAVVDDNISKTDKMIVRKKIIAPSQITDYEHDGILISTYTHHKAIFNNLSDQHYDLRNVIQFFNMKSL